MRKNRKEKIHALLKGIETGDPESVKVVNESMYIQHNPQTHEGGDGLALLFERLSKTNPKVEIVRIFEDGDFVFGHTIYDFSSVRIGFEVFRFEGEFVVEHWDNIQARDGTMVGGSTEVTDLDKTEINRELVKNFINEVFINRDFSKLERFINANQFIEHSPRVDISEKAKTMEYIKNHRVLAEGNFVLSINEGNPNGIRSSFYDLFRLENGKIIEHWDTSETVPPKSEWKNNNGKF